MSTTFQVSSDGNNWQTTGEGSLFTVLQGSTFNLHFRIVHDRANLQKLLLKLPVFMGLDRQDSQVTEKDALIDFATWEALDLNRKDGDAMVVTPDKRIGVFAITAKDGGALLEEITLHLQDSNQHFVGALGTAIVSATSIQKNNQGQWVETLLGKVVVHKIEQVVIPTIVSFTSNFYFLPEGNFNPTLSWKIENAVQPIQLKANNSSDLLNDEGKLTATGSFLVQGNDENQPGTTTYTLKTGTEVLRTLKVTRHSTSGYHSLQNALPGAAFMGLYVYDGSLYATVLGNDRKNAFLATSRDGRSWNLVTDGSYYVSFRPAAVAATEDEVANASLPLPGTVPLEMAGSPGVVLDGVLYLIGGSRFDPYFVSNAMVTYQFDKPFLGFQSTSARFEARMGHSVVVFNQKIYVLGGANNEGALADVWSYDPANNYWQQEKSMGLGSGACMFGLVAYGKKLYRFGGFAGMPGENNVQLDASMLVYDMEQPQSRCEKVEPPKSCWENVKLYNTAHRLLASGLMFLPQSEASNTESDYLFAVAYTKEPSTNAKDQFTISFAPSANTPGNKLDAYGLSSLLFTKGFAQSIQCVTFKNVVWICVNAVGNDGEANSGPLGYFVYNGI
jgi:hypothetical protein